MDKIILDTNVIISALKSSRGASYKLVSMIGSGKFLSCVSVPLILEYEDVIHRHFPTMKEQHINDFLDYLCAVSRPVKISFLWRPFLRDPGDDLLLELAISANATYIITYNKKDFVGTDKFNTKVINPKEYLDRLGDIP